MRSASDYASKLERIGPQTLLSNLDPAHQDFVRRQAERYRFTYQELRKVAQAARDLEMWCEAPLSEWWPQAERQVEGDGRSRKKQLLQALEGHVSLLARSEKVYPHAALAGPRRRAMRLEERDSERKIFGLCPAYSERTVCCGLHTLDVVRGCAFSCSYCTIQTFYDQVAELEADLPHKLAAIELDPGRRYHIGTGQSSDSLIWGNRGGTLDALLEFAAAHPNALLELKTKSDNIGYLLQREVPANLVCAWTLNTPAIIANEEHGSASLERRLAAARRAADCGIAIAFHFHPMVFYQGWQSDYRSVAARILSDFGASEVSFVSMGSMTLIKPVIREIRRRGGETKILQMEMVPDPHGKLTYPDPVKIDLFQNLYRSLAPWHGGVFFYLCMETAEVWRPVLGEAYGSNDEFERSFLDRCLPTPVEAIG